MGTTMVIWGLVALCAQGMVTGFPDEGFTFGNFVKLAKFKVW